jgi:hypothetical protein
MPDEALTMVAVDGRDAFAYVIIRPGPDGNVVVEAAANGISHGHAAYVLRHIAEKWTAMAVEEAAAKGASPDA